MTRPSLPHHQRATAAGAIPSEHWHIGLTGAGIARVWLVDLSGARPPVEVAVWRTREDLDRDLYGAPFATSADGSRLIVIARGPGGRDALYLIETVTGAVTLLFDQPNVDASAPVLSEDGSRFAFLKVFPDDRRPPPPPLVLDDGIWVGDIATRSTAKRVGPTRFVGSSFSGAPIAFSADARWLWTRKILDPGVEFVAAHELPDGRSITLGGARDVALRQKEPSVLVAQGTLWPPTYTLATYDVSTGTRQEIPVAGGQRYRWHPSDERFLYLVDSELWTRDLLAERGQRVSDLTFIEDARWSRDGSRIYGVRGEPYHGGRYHTSPWGPTNNAVVVLDATSRRQLAVLCHHGTPRPQAPRCPGSRF